MIAILCLATVVRTIASLPPAAILVEHDDEKIRGVFEYAGMHNGAPAFEENMTGSAIARDVVGEDQDFEWVLGSWIPAPKLLCSSSSGELVPPLVRWTCKQGRDPSISRLTKGRVASVYEKARAHQLKHRPRLALLYMRAALAATQDSPHSLLIDILISLGLLYRHVGRTEEAIEYLSRMKTIPSEDAVTRVKIGSALSILGSIYATLGRHQDALDTRLSASSADVDNPDIWRTVGESLSALRRHEEAERAFRTARGLLISQQVPIDTRVSTASLRSPLLWALVLQGLGNALREIGMLEDAVFFWNEGARRGIWPNTFRRFSIPWPVAHVPNGPIPKRAGRDAAVIARRTSCDSTRGDKVDYPHHAVEALETNFADIRNEVLAVVDSASHPFLVRESEGLHRGVSWTHMRLTDRSSWSDNIASLLPFTSSVLRSIRWSDGDSGEELKPYELCASQRLCPSDLFAQISQLERNTTITPHCGPTNLRLRIQLPLRVPFDGCCGLKVWSGANSSETHYLREGKALVFDDSFEHEAWYSPHPNQSVASLSSSFPTRVILIVDVWHPHVPIAVARQRHGIVN
eukprot:g3133.t1